MSKTRKPTALSRKVEELSPLERRRAREELQLRRRRDDKRLRRAEMHSRSE